MVSSCALPGFTVDFSKFANRDWLGMMADIKTSIDKREVDAAMSREYGL